VVVVGGGRAGLSIARFSTQHGRHGHLNRT